MILSNPIKEKRRAIEHMIYGSRECFFEQRDRKEIQLVNIAKKIIRALNIGKSVSLDTE